MARAFVMVVRPAQGAPTRMYNFSTRPKQQTREGIEVIAAERS